ncbi:hypothetical protein KAR91_56710 [Candidatus Pacearchaeota archaeon]|nr:hypothetical protein [Candidatus Pacearchaeota archaeon]
MNDTNKMSSEDKKVLEEALRKTNNLPPAQGQVTLNISPENKVVSVEINIVKR